MVLYIANLGTRIERSIVISENKLNELFVSQITTPKRHGYPEYILKDLRKQQELVIEKALSIIASRPPNSVFSYFFPVVPFASVSFGEQLDIVQIKGCKVYSELDAKKFVNKVEVPSCPYYIFNADRVTIIRHNQRPETTENWLQKIFGNR